MAARTKSYVTPKDKTRYRVKNWPAYEAGLRKRGDVTVWFDDGCADSWSAPSSGLPGGQRRYSDLAIVTALTLRTVFHLALRQAEGFVGSLVRLMGLDLDNARPHHALPAQRRRRRAPDRQLRSPCKSIHEGSRACSSRWVAASIWDCSASSMSPPRESCRTRKPSHATCRATAMAISKSPANA